MPDKATLNKPAATKHSFRYDKDTDTYDVENVPVFATGKWHGEDYTEAVVDQIIADSVKAFAFLEPRLGIGHPKDGENESTIPSWGGFDGLKRVGKLVYANLRKIPSVVFKAIQARNLGAISVEMRKFKVPDSDTVLARVIDRIRFLGLAPPEVPYAGVKLTAEEIAERVCVTFAAQDLGFTDTEGAGIPPAETDTSAVPDQSEREARGGQMSDELKAREETLAAQRDKFAAEQKAAEDKLAADQAAVDEQRRTLHAAHVDDSWMKILDGGHATAAEAEGFKEMAGSFDQSESKKYFSNVTNLTETWLVRPAVHKLPTKGAPKGRTDDVTPESVDVEDRILMAAAEICDKNPAMVMSEAIGLVEENHPEWDKEFRAKFAGVAPAGALKATVVREED